MLRYGVNYVPPKDWFYSWQDIDLAAVDEDFHAIRELGFDHMRLHLRWDLFQPNAAFVSKKLLNDLSCMLDKAYKYGLDVQIAALDGWMSGFWFLPNFIGNRNIVTDEDVIRAEEYFLAELARAVGSHPALMGIDIGNEINMFATRLRLRRRKGTDGCGGYLPCWTSCSPARTTWWASIISRGFPTCSSPAGRWRGRAA